MEWVAVRGGIRAAPENSTGVDSGEWQLVAIAAAVIVGAVVLAWVIDRAIIRHLHLPPRALTRYRVLRRSITASIVALGVLSGLLVIPGVRAVAGGILASGAVVGVILGFAARSTLANFIAGVMIAFTQPLRLGDEIEVADASGTVEEVALTYTTIRTPAGARTFVPNEKLASDTIKNLTIAGHGRRALVAIPVPLAADLDRVVSLAEEEARGVAHTEDREPTATVTDFARETQTAVVTVHAWAPSGRVLAVESDIRRAVHRRLRAEGVF
jgi:small-conductance mechanosensitive channel